MACPSRESRSERQGFKTFLTCNSINNGNWYKMLELVAMAMDMKVFELEIDIVSRKKLSKCESYVE